MLFVAQFTARTAQPFLSFRPLPPTRFDWKVMGTQSEFQYVGNGWMHYVQEGGRAEIRVDIYVYLIFVVTLGSRVVYFSFCGAAELVDDVLC